MWRKWLPGSGSNPAAAAHFRPLYSLDQLGACGRLPIVCVLAFETQADETTPAQPGPGVGGILASLLRRDLGMTRRVSVLGGEDSSYMPLAGAHAAADEDLLTSFPDYRVLVVGSIRRDSPGQFLLSVRTVVRDAPAEETAHRRPILIRFVLEQVRSLSPALATAVCQRLRVSVADNVAARWKQHLPPSCKGLLLAGRAWEQEAYAKLVGLLESGSVHPDAAARIDSDQFDKVTAVHGLSLANDAEPDNPQLAFKRFIGQWQGNERPAPKLEGYLRAGLQAVPGHGKSHMVLPHILAPLTENIPYILAHSEVGYRLLPGNSFALSNFSNYIGRHAPGDPREFQLLVRAIEYEPLNPTLYNNAISCLLTQNRAAEAARFAEKLVKLCTPPMSERSLYCLRQAPGIAAQIDAGTFDPHRWANNLLEICRRKMRGD